jgi:hypothetical protein
MGNPMINPNGTSNTNGVNIRATAPVPQAQMQAYMQNQHRLPSQTGQDSARIMMEASRVSEQQRMMQQQRQFQTNGLNGSPSLPLQPNAAMLANIQAANGKLSPAANGVTNQSRSSSSPSTNGTMPSQQLSSGMIPVLNQISQHLKALHPNASAEQIKQMATANLNQQLRTQQANSLAVSGNNIQQQMGFTPNATVNMNPVLYAQYMRSQQASQQNRNNSGRASSPNNNEASRPDSRGSAIQKQNNVVAGSSQSPRPPPQPQLAGTTS